MALKAPTSCALADNTFGPATSANCRGGFDFTLLFEETILSILPLTFILVVAPFRVLYLFKKQTKIIRGKRLLLHTKLVWASLTKCMVL